MEIYRRNLGPCASILTVFRVNFGVARGIPHHFCFTTRITTRTSKLP